MKSILFVCHGNICRSPMAEFLMRDRAERLGIPVCVASAATSTEELGNPVHHGTRRILAKHGISTAGKTARRMTAADYNDYDMLIGMDDTNVRNMVRISGGDPEGKIYRLLDIAGEDRDVADPWYTGDFEKTYHDVSIGIDAVLKKYFGVK